MENQRIFLKSHLFGIYNEAANYWWFIEESQIRTEALANEVIPGFKTQFEIPEDDIKVETI